MEEPIAPSFRAHDLAVSTQVGRDGGVIYRGLRHRVIDPKGCDRRFLNRLSEQALHRFLHQFEPASPFPDKRSKWIQSTVRALSGAPYGSDQPVRILQASIQKTIFTDLAAAALAAEPEKRQPALRGETVDLDLCLITLSSDSNLLLRLYHTGEALTRHSPQYVTLVDGNRQPHTPRVRIHASMPLCSPTGDQLPRQLHAHQHAVLGQTLGDLNQWHLGGNALRRVEAMKTDARSIQVDTGPQHKEKQRLLRSARTLTQAGEQLKELWSESRGWPADNDLQIKAASRLALVAHLMGSTPVLSCEDVTQTRRLDAESRFLATVADNSDGTVVPLGLNMEVWRIADF